MVPAMIAGDRAVDIERAFRALDLAVLGWLASHPSAGERAQAYRAAARTAPAYPPVLSDAEFAALKSMCADDPDVAEFDFF